MSIPKSELDCIVVEPGTSVRDATIIWLHGLGADGNDFVDIIDELGLPSTHKIRFIFPHAPYRAITINGGMNMRGWYDLCGLEIGSREDVPGIVGSAQHITRLIEQEIASGVAANRIILAGFSQGGALALYAGLRFKRTLAGIIVLSAYQVAEDRLNSERHAANQAVPIFMAHGIFDQMVPFDLGQKCYQQLSALHYPVKWHEYPMQHTVVLEEIQHIGEFINQVLF